jgi:hypothetical protein
MHAARTASITRLNSCWLGLCLLGDPRGQGLGAAGAGPLLRYRRGSRCLGTVCPGQRLPMRVRGSCIRARIDTSTATAARQCLWARPLLRWWRGRGGSCRVRPPSCRQRLYCRDLAACRSRLLDRYRRGSGLARTLISELGLPRQGRCSRWPWPELHRELWPRDQWHSRARGQGVRWHDRQRRHGHVVPGCHSLGRPRVHHTRRRHAQRRRPGGVHGHPRWYACTAVGRDDVDQGSSPHPRGQHSQATRYCWPSPAVLLTHMRAPWGNVHARNGPVGWRRHPWMRHPWMRHPWMRHPWMRHPWMRHPWIRHPWMRDPWRRRHPQRRRRLWQRHPQRRSEWRRHCSQH